MLKRVALITRKPGMTRDEFHAHWNAIHGPLVAEHPNVLRYVQFVRGRKDKDLPRMPLMFEPGARWATGSSSLIRLASSSPARTR